MKRWFKSPLMNWAITLVSIFRIIEYIRQTKAPNPDSDAMYIAVAWAFILGLNLAGAILRPRTRKRRARL